MKVEEILIIIIGILSLIIFYKIYKGSLIEGLTQSMCNPDPIENQFCPGGIPCPQCGHDACPCPPSPTPTPTPPPPPTSKLSPNTTCKAFMNSETFKNLSYNDSYVLDKKYFDTECNEGENEENSCMTNMDNGGKLNTGPCYYKFDTTDFKTTCENFKDTLKNSDYTPKPGNNENSPCCFANYNSYDLNPDETLACNFGTDDKLQICDNACIRSSLQTTPYIPPINILSIGDSPIDNENCSNMESDWVRPQSDNDGKKKYCNVYYNSDTNRRCKPDPGRVCMEGDDFDSSIKCEKLIDYQCNAITDDDVKLGVPFADGNRWNQGLCQAYHEYGNICVGSPMGSGHPCIKSNEKKCLL